ncbi:MAG TPA: hypothetical protein GXX42_08810 [Petrimonas sp.]|uniref:BT0820 family HAD-type phosphatase n=1 Tax=Petrimonas sp. TaxID=2023866 RepID=UPI000960B556|nr:hypothetical protein [Petrimonas sp.]OJV34285.1 MAG: hypothetical protein BGO33_09695 [Bacteroidia bacterium 43-41]MEA4980133.1 hypothetical protein [Petrimonas sp.]MEA5046347.1 hypothetical protein [Petrimonas sp.]MEA5063599.1 hypothetical protein [Petrimonas sp.]
MIIAIDFDGTIVEHAYPKIGKPIPFAIETLRMLHNDGHQLILWTVREGRLLQEAIDYCERNGICLFAVNANYPEEDRENSPRKLMADLFIDDRNLGGLPDWGIIYKAVEATVKGENSFNAIMNNAPVPLKKEKRGFRGLFK